MRRLEKNLTSDLAAIQAARPDASVEVWVMDEHRVGLQPIVRRVWAPRSQRPRAVMQARDQWRYLVGWVHPASGHTFWHWADTVNLAVFGAELAAFARQVGAGPERQIALILAGRRLTSPRAAQRARPWPSHPAAALFAGGAARRTAVALQQRVATQHPFRRCGGLEEAQMARCAALQTDPMLVITLQAATHYHWWPADLSPTA